MSRDSDKRDSVSDRLSSLKKHSQDTYFEQFSSKEITPVPGLNVEELMKEAYKDDENERDSSFFSPMDSELLQGLSAGQGEFDKDGAPITS